jgi:C4-dicarboxylate transporter/malic acid transport protein
MPHDAINPPISAGRAEHGVLIDTVVRRFTPNWFTVTMGTGILALALKQAPFGVPAITRAAEALWFLNIGLFGLFSVLYAARWSLFFHEARRIFEHSTMSMFFGAIPMGLATIVNGVLAFGVARWGEAAVEIATALWAADAVLAVACGVLVPYLMFTRQDHSMENMTAIWLMPVVAAEVAAATAGLLAPHLADPQSAFRVVMIGYALWAFSVPVALSFLVILLLRLALHKLPHRDMAASGFLSLGPIGTGALGLLLLGGDAPAIFAAAGPAGLDLAGIGAVAMGIGVIGGAMLWGYGGWWLLLSLLTTARYLRHGLPFNLGWWAFTFPLGVYTVATLVLGRQTGLGFVTAIGGVLVVCLAVLWTIVSARTLRGAWSRRLFVSPCLAPPLGAA